MILLPTHAGEWPENECRNALRLSFDTGSLKQGKGCQGKIVVL